MQRQIFHSKVFGLTTKAALIVSLLGCPMHFAKADDSSATSGTSRVVSIAPELQVVDKYLLGIPKSGFGKDYEFTASIIPQELAATSTGLEGKIVRFELFPDGVDMYESTDGIVVTHDLPVRRLIASFNIVRQDGDKVVIDFNKGMRRVFTTSWTAGADDFLDIEGRDRVLEVPESRVFEMRQDKDRVVIRQSVQLRNRAADPNLESRFEMRYFLSPYKPGNFAGKEPNRVDDRYTRFFETEGEFEEGTGRISSRIVRFDLDHPIVFYYSANTPTNYVEAVRDAILYWNTAFGKQIVQAKKAPDGETAPNAEHNIIQWVPWDNAGFAYADVLMDPVNGHTEHGQAYITSVFAFEGRAGARILLRSMEELGDKGGSKKHGLHTHRPLAFLNAAPGCDVDEQLFAQALASGVQDALATDALSDAAVLRMSQDYVREVVAHEVGHVLGLRHNFAGSLEGNIDRLDLDNWFRAYVAGKPLDDYTNKITTSTVMDYNTFKAAVFTGWRIRTLKEALPYDRGAITWGYFDNPEVREKKMFFGTDQDVGTYGDVQRFDYGEDPVVNAYADNAHFIEMLPNDIIETFIRARAPHNPKDRFPLEQVNLSYTMFARQIANYMAQELSWFNADRRSLRVERQFDFIGDLNRKERYQAHWQYLTNQIEKLGGIDRAVFSFMPVDLKLDLKDKPAGLPVADRLSATNLTARLEKLLASTNYATFVGLDDKKYTFTKDERDLILKRGKKCFDELEDEVIRQICLRLTNTPRNLAVEANGNVSDNDIISKLEQRIIDLAKLVVLAKDDSKRIKGTMDKAFVEVPEFKYDIATRLAAAHMLAANNGSFKGWADTARGDLNEDLKKEVDAALNLEHFKDFKPSMLSRPLLEWYQEQQDLIMQLPPPPPPPAR